MIKLLGGSAGCCLAVSAICKLWQARMRQSARLVCFVCVLNGHLSARIGCGMFVCTHGACMIATLLVMLLQHGFVGAQAYAGWPARSVFHAAQQLTHCWAYKLAFRHSKSFLRRRAPSHGAALLCIFGTDSFTCPVAWSSTL